MPFFLLTRHIFELKVWFDTVSSSFQATHLFLFRAISRFFSFFWFQFLPEFDLHQTCFGEEYLCWYYRPVSRMSVISKLDSSKDWSLSSRLSSFTWVLDDFANISKHEWSPSYWCDKFGFRIYMHPNQHVSYWCQSHVLILLYFDMFDAKQFTARYQFSILNSNKKKMFAQGWYYCLKTLFTYFFTSNRFSVKLLRRQNLWSKDQCKVQH